jgi:hypothetical protein
MIILTHRGQIRIISSVVDWSSRFLPEDETGGLARYLRLRRVLMRDVDSHLRFCTPGKLDGDLEFFMKLNIFCACGKSVSMVRTLRMIIP